MRKKYIAAFIAGAVFTLPNFAHASVTIQSVQVGSPTAIDEYFTLYNADDVPQDLTGWSVQEKSDTAATVQKKNFVSGMKIPAHGTVMIANGGGIYAAQALMTYASFSLPEGGATIVVAPTTTLLGAFPDAPPNAAVYHYGSTGAATSSAQTTTTSTPVTGATSSTAISVRPDVFFSHADPPPYEIKISELLPHPHEYQNEFIELYNPNTVAVSIGGYTLADASGNAYALGTRAENTTLMPKEYRAWKRSVTSIALNDTDGEEITLQTPKGALVDRATYFGDAPIDASFSFVHDGWHWTQAATPNNENEFGELPAAPIARAVIPSNAFVGTTIECSATDTTDPNNDIQKYEWDFGDGTTAAGITVTHAYATSGTYAITFTATDSQNLQSSVARTITIQNNSATSSAVKISAAAIEYEAQPKSKPKKSVPRSPTYTGTVTVAPGILGSRTLVVDNRTVEFTANRVDLKKLKPGSFVHFGAHKIFKSNRLILQVTKKDPFIILTEHDAPPAQIYTGVVKMISKTGTTIAASSSDMLLPPKNLPIAVPKLSVGDSIEIYGILLADEAMTPLVIPTEKIIVHPANDKTTAATTSKGFLLMYGSGLLLILMYFVLTKNRIGTVVSWFSKLIRRPLANK